MNKDELIEILGAGCFALITFLGIIGAVVLVDNFVNPTQYYSAGYGYTTTPSPMFDLGMSYVLFLLVVYGTVFGIGCGAYIGYKHLKSRYKIIRINGDV